MRSRAPGMSDTMHGTPQAWASRRVRGEASRVLLSTYRWWEGMKSTASRRFPRKHTVSGAKALSASSTSPITVSAASTPRSFRICMASSRGRRPLCGLWRKQPIVTSLRAASATLCGGVLGLANDSATHSRRKGLHAVLTFSAPTIGASASRMSSVSHTMWATRGLSSASLLPGSERCTRACVPL